MDSFASYRLARNLSAVSVQWGPWAEIGMAARVAWTKNFRIRRLEGAAGGGLGGWGWGE